MKYLILLIVILVVIWMMRSKRPSTPPSRGAPPTGPHAQQQLMVTCAQCGVHLPRDEALPGRGGVFCGEAHRAAYEKAHAGE